jgi:hypothetical protein
LRAITRLTIHTPTNQQRQQLQKALAPVQTDLARRIGSTWVDTAMDALRKKLSG